MSNLAEIAAILQTTEKNVATRIVKMKLGEVCSRCGGSGNYSFNQINGTTCFKCHGVGNTVPKSAKGLTQVKAQAEAAVRSGALARYLDEVRAAKTVKDGEDRVFAAWHKIGETFPGHASKVNARCAKAHEALAVSLRAYQFPGKGKQRIPATEVEAALIEAMAVIAGAYAEVEACAAANPEEYRASLEQAIADARRYAERSPWGLSAKLQARLDYWESLLAGLK